MLIGTHYIRRREENNGVGRCYSNNGYGDNKNFLLSDCATLCHTSGMLIAAPGRTARAHIAIHVFLRLTAMDVCCGPPSTL